MVSAIISEEAANYFNTIPLSNNIMNSHGRSKHIKKPIEKSL